MRTLLTTTVERLCSWFDITPQAYYADRRKLERQAVCYSFIIEKVQEIREKHKKMGGKKIYGRLTDFMAAHGMKMGRDAFFDLLRDNSLLIKPRRRSVRTTDSNHFLRRYPNLINDFVPTAPNQVWASDITYWKIGDKFVYITFIIDTYSRKLVGYNVAESMDAMESVKALKMALKPFRGKVPVGLIHHSDRGSQYCSYKYVNLLQKNGVLVSMTQSGDPLENAVAERINGIMKHEYLYHSNTQTFGQAKKRLNVAVLLYNTERPHLSLNYQVPSEVHDGTATKPVKRRWKNIYKRVGEK